MAYSLMLKFGYSEKATKVWKNLPIFWHYYCQFQQYGRFFKHFVVFSEYLNLKFPNGPVNNFQEVFNDPQVLHNEMVQTVTDETFGEIKQVIHNDTVGSNAFWCRMPCPSMGPKWFWTVQIFLVEYQSFWTGPIRFGQEIKSNNFFWNLCSKNVLTRLQKGFEPLFSIFFVVCGVIHL